MLRLFPTPFFLSFSVSGFTCRSFIHLDMSFVEEDKNGSIYKLLHADPAPLTENPIFFPLDGFGFSVKDQVTISIWVYFWVFNGIPLINLSVSVPCGFYHYRSVIHLEVRDYDSPRTLGPWQGCSGCLYMWTR